MASNTETPWHVIYSVTETDASAPGGIRHRIVSDACERPDAALIVGTHATVCHLRGGHPALKADAERIVRAVNAHEALVESLSDCVNWLEALRDIGDQGAVDEHVTLSARYALALAEGE